MLKNMLYRFVSLGGLLFVVALLFGCTAKIPEMDENGLPAHITIDLHLPKQLNVGSASDFSVDVFKSGKPVEQADQADFVFWPAENPDMAVIVKATESSPGVYSVSHNINEEGIYYVQALINTDGDKVMPAKRFAIGSKAVEQLIAMESSADPDDADHGGHH